MEFHKLVRDRIPEMIEALGEAAVTRKLDEEEYLHCLEQKLDEEVAEYHESKNIEELADILEVLLALNAAHGHPSDALISAYQEKHRHRAGFDKRIFLISKKKTQKIQNTP